MLAKNMPSRVLKARSHSSAAVCVFVSETSSAHVVDSCVTSQVEDVAPQIADLSQEENHVLSVFSWTAAMDTVLRKTPSLSCSE